MHGDGRVLFPYDRKIHGFYNFNIKLSINVSKPWQDIYVAPGGKRHMNMAKVYNENKREYDLYESLRCIQRLYPFPEQVKNVLK